MNREQMLKIARDAAWKQFRRMQSSNPGDYAFHVVQALVAAGCVPSDELIPPTAPVPDATRSASSTYKMVDPYKRAAVTPDERNEP